MTKQQIDRFFRMVARELDQPAWVIVTGAAAASMWGAARASLDIDFAMDFSPVGKGDWAQLERAVGQAMRITGIRANYAQDIDKWGQISLLDYRRHTVPYQSFRKLEVRVLDPAYWSIGKISRYLDPDVHDLVAVFKLRKVSLTRRIKLWGQAMKASPPSSARTNFGTQAEHFLRSHGRAIWGTKFNPETTAKRFRLALASK